MSSTITITRAERDLIVVELWRWVPPEAIPFETRERAAASVLAVQWAFDLRDELGWSDEDPRETFTLTLTPEVVDLVRSAVDDAASLVTLQREHREKAHAGDRGHWLIGYATLDSVLAQYDRQIATFEDERRVIDGLLKRIDAGPVAA